MGETINLGKFRKAKAKEQKEKRASENRIAHGRSKQEKLLDERAQKTAKKEIDAKKLEQPEKD